MYLTRSQHFPVEVLAPTCLQIAQQQAGFSLIGQQPQSMSLLLPLERNRKLTPVGVMTGTPRPRGSPRPQSPSCLNTLRWLGLSHRLVNHRCIWSKHTGCLHSQLIACSHAHIAVNTPETLSQRPQRMSRACITCRGAAAESPAVFQLMTGCALKLQQAIDYTHPNTVNVKLGTNIWWQCEHLVDIQELLWSPTMMIWL